jgi:hypothetical protein
MNQTLTPCSDFVEHPHIVEQKIFTMDGQYKETRLGSCYRCQCAEASERQGINAIVQDLGKFGISASVEQTGGFTMCAYVVLTATRYIFANRYGASVYSGDNYICDVSQYDDEQPAWRIAKDVHNYINGRKEKK